MARREFIDFIAISNKDFIFKPINESKIYFRRFIEHYDRNNVIVIPFNADIKSLIEIQGWKNAGITVKIVDNNVGK